MLNADNITCQRTNLIHSNENFVEFQFKFMRCEMYDERHKRRIFPKVEIDGWMDEMVNCVHIRFMCHTNDMTTCVCSLVFTIFSLSLHIFFVASFLRLLCDDIFVCQFDCNITFSSIFYSSQQFSQSVSHSVLISLIKKKILNAAHDIRNWICNM